MILYHIYGYTGKFKIKIKIKIKIRSQLYPELRSPDFGLRI